MARSGARHTSWFTGDVGGTDPDVGGGRDRVGRARHRRRVPRSRGRGSCDDQRSRQRNHDELFPGHVSTLKVTDPELIEVFDNFAFDEVLQHGDLDTRTRLMVQLAAIIACQARQRVPGDARRRADRRCHAGRGEGDRLPGRAVRRAGQGVRVPARHQRGAHRAWCGAAAAAAVGIDTADRAEVGLAVQNADRRRRRRSTACMHPRADDERAHPALPVGELFRRLRGTRRVSTCRRGNC